MFAFVFVAASWIAAAVRLLVFPGGPLTASLVTDTFLQYSLVGVVGLGGLFAASGHLFNARDVAAGIGWPPDNPFQHEVGFSNLAFGILGIVCAWQGPAFWAAVTVGQAVFVLGAGATHVADLRRRANRASLNAGAILWFDFSFPLIMLALLLVHYVLGRTQAAG